MMDPAKAFPRIAPLGATGLLVTFGSQLDGGANHAAIAFRAAVDVEAWEGVEETATSLVSVGIRFDPLKVEFRDLAQKVSALLAQRNWFDEALTAGRLWTIPVSFGGSLGPDLAAAAAQVGVSQDIAIEQFCAAQVQVLTIGFAPGQPYLGMLPPQWDIPRRTELNPKVPKGAIVMAIRQAIVFTNETPTGWWHIGQSGFQNFRPDNAVPFAFRAGDQVRFRAVSAQQLDHEVLTDTQAMGGARCEEIQC